MPTPSDPSEEQTHTQQQHQEPSAITHPFSSLTRLSQGTAHASCPTEEATTAIVENEASIASNIEPANNDELSSTPQILAPSDLQSIPMLGQSPVIHPVLQDFRMTPSPSPPADEQPKGGDTSSATVLIPFTKPAMPSSHPIHTPESLETPSLNYFPRHTSSYLRNGSKFVGTQQSDRQVYNVEVDVKYVDMHESFICGYLRIEGLTADHPSLTTYFEGEIVGNKYSFRTRHPSWGASEKVDMQHWSRFQAWRPLANRARRPDFSYKDFAEQEHIFMRWKEAFLVPDHRVRTINGASFEGFYYICFNQINGTISGIYFHSKSEKFQQLELRHVEDRGCFGAVEFR